MKPRRRWASSAHRLWTRIPSFVKTASYGDTLQVHVSVKEWRDKSFVQAYRMMRGDDLIMQCDEVRIFAARRTDGKNGIRAVPIPPEIRALCS